NKARVARRTARKRRKKHARTLGCPFGGVGAAAGVLLLVSEVEPFSTTEGRGGSSTSVSVNTGFGASAGGKLGGGMIDIRP
ncbi:hypothetical protein U1Q18_000335, partial [Sarracenia purpurea var. burkii]